MDIVKLIVSIVICQAAGFAGFLFTRPAIPTWYASLQKPPFTPPSWLFGPVWVTLYLLMGIALFLVWKRGLHRPGVQYAFTLFFIQLALNALWSALFFGLRSPLLGFADITLLWILLLFTLVAFFRLSVAAGALLLPYFFWTSFAAVLNFAILRLNS
ncbi:MAG: TspO/MBR family protein [Endomicrobiales bacterium]